MQNKSVKKVFLLTLMPLLLAIFLVLGVAGVKPSQSALAATSDNPIDVSLVTVSDTVPINYENKSDTPSIVQSVDGKIEYDGISTPFVLLNNTYSELDDDYTVNPLGTRVTLSDGTIINRESGKFEINSEYYFYDSKTQKILKHEGKHQAVRLKVGDEKTAFNVLNLTIKLNGVELQQNDNNSASGSNQYFQQLLHGLPASFVQNAGFSSYFNTVSKNGPSNLEVVEGLYEINLTYRISAGALQTAKFQFYLITTNSYANEDESVKFDYTQKLHSDKETDIYAVEHYFNQTNVNTTFKDETPVVLQSGQNVLFPTINYNPEKYKVSYKRTLYSYVEFGEFSFRTITPMKGILTETITRNNITLSSTQKFVVKQTPEFAGEYTINKNGTLFKSVTVNGTTYLENTNGVIVIEGKNYFYNNLTDTINEYDENAVFIGSWTFEKLGNYEFYKKCTIKTTENNYVEANNITLTNVNLLKTEALFMNGFQATYSKGGTGTDFLRNEEYNSDFTFLNNNVINTYSAGSIFTMPSEANVVVNDKNITFNGKTLKYDTSLAITNQSPVKLEYNASLNRTANTSWYIYQNNNKEISVKNFNYSTIFNEPGTYFVYLSFNNKSNKASTTNTQQFIAFKIDNTPPTIIMNTTESTSGTYLVDENNRVIEDENSKILGVDEFTNKNVYIKWNLNGPFSAEIYGVYIERDYQDKIVIENKSFNGLVCYQQDGIKYANDDATIFSENGHYTVKVFYTNSKKSFVTSTFTIDKTDISGITALKVNTGTKQLANITDNSSLANNVISTLSDNPSEFKLVTNTPFVWTWNEKESGASIKAKYYYSSISNINNFKTSLISNSQEEWILANGEFSLLTTSKDYRYTKVTEQNFKTVTFTSSQIFSTSRMGVLVLEDEAGNKATFVTIFDDISPEFIQQEGNSNTAINSTMISKTSKLSWGSHKALSTISDDENLDIGDLITSANENGIWNFDGNDFKVNDVLLTSLNSYFNKDATNNMYFKTRIKNSTLNLEGHNYVVTPKLSSSTWKNTYMWVVIEEVDGVYYTYLSVDYDFESKTGTPYNNMPKLELSKGLTMTPRILTINIYDELNNQRQRTKQISLDKSQGSMFSHSTTVSNDGISNTTDVSNSNDLDDPSKTNRKQLFGNNSTNRDFVTFSFLQQDSGIFVVEKITLDFYALTYDKNSENYPYSNTSNQQQIFINGEENNSWNTFKLEGIEGTFYHSYALKNTGLLSQAGMYVITRTYSTDFDKSSLPEKEGDVNNLKYTFFVDRTEIISINRDGEYVTGEDISINLGNYDYGQNYPDESVKIFKDFSKQIILANEFSNSFKIKNSNIAKPIHFAVNSNILPTRLALELVNDIGYKYKFTSKVTNDNGTPDLPDDDFEEDHYIYNTLNNNMTLMVVVQQFNTTSSLVSQKLYTSAVLTPNYNENIYPIKDLNSNVFKDIGAYRVMIVDGSNLTGSLSGSWEDLKLWEHSRFIPNHTIFSFEITSKTPSASAVVHSSSISSPFTTLPVSYNIMNNQGYEAYYLSNNNNVLITFSDTADEFRAKIAHNDILLSQTLYYLDNSGIMTKGQTKSITLSGARTWSSNPNDLEVMKEIFSETEIARINDEYSGELLTTLALSTKDVNNGILYYRELISQTTDRYNYYILLPALEKTKGYQSDCLYSLNYNYIGDKEDYKQIKNNADGTSIVSYSSFENSTKTYIDHTSPYRNLLDLINQDTYLTSEQKADILLNLNNPDYEFLQEYAFAVGPNFSLTNYGDAENGSVFYYQKYENGKYENGKSLAQTSVPGSTAYDTNISTKKFSENTYNSMYYSSFPTEAGYYDIIEIDKAGNYRVYTIYLNRSAVELSATGTDAQTAENAINSFSLISSFDNNTPVYQIKVNSNDVWTTIYSSSGIQNTTEAVISTHSFNLQSLVIQDAWFKIQYRLHNGSSSSIWNTITITPSDSTSAILETLNAYITSEIQKGKLAKGCKMEFVINNRAGNDIRFFLHTPGVDLSLQDLNPTKIGQSSFTITLPADTYSTQFDNFIVKMNGSVELSKDAQNKPISTVYENRNQPQNFVFNLSRNTKYTFEFTDNFGKKYLFVYPTTENLVNEIVYAEGSSPKLHNGVMYTSNETKFRYTSSTSERISITITDQTTGNILMALNNLPYSNSADTTKNPKDLLTASVMYSNYFGLSKIGTTVTLTFYAINNTHYTYEINFVDIDNNETTHTFGIYTFAPIVNLTDNAGVAIWSAGNKDKVTSKTVVARWNENTSILFNPYVEVVYNGSSYAISSPYSMSQEGTYTIRVINNLGTINNLTTTFTIKPATVNLYSVYFKDTLLTAHSVKYLYQVNDTDIRQIDHYFFLSNSVSDWDNNIKILPNEDKELTTSEISRDGNTRIYRVYGNAHDIYFAITQIYSSSNNLTTFGLHTYTDDTEPTQSSVISSTDYTYRLEPDVRGKSTYGQIHWNTSYTDPSNGNVYEDFVYLYVTYNDTIPMGKFTDGVLNLTKSGKYQIQIYDIVGQTHRFGTAIMSTTFTLTILNDIIFYVNNESPIANATYNDSVILSLVDISNYSWENTGTIKVLKNNVIYTDYVQNGTTWTFKDAGHYKVTLTTKTSTATESTITAEYSFTIIDKNESKLIYDFAKISGYTVESIQQVEYGTYSENNASMIKLQELKNKFNSLNSDNFKLELTKLFTSILSSSLSDNELAETVQTMVGNIKDKTEYSTYENFETDLLSLYAEELNLYRLKDITNLIKNLYGVATIQNFSLSNDTTGVGKYLITINVKEQELIPEQTYSFVVWINNEIPVIQSSRDFGSSATSAVTISYNPSLIYQQVGNSYIALNGVRMATIDASREDENAISTFTFGEPGTYFVQVYSESGTLLSSQRITIDVPLNTAAIILIVVGCLVVVAVIVIFVVLRTKMKIK